MKQVIIAISVALSLSACAPTIYNKPGATASDFEQDKLYCEYQANRSNPYSGGPFADPLMVGIERGNMMKMCLVVEKGWTKQR